MSAWELLKRDADLAKALESKSDETIANLLQEHVWANMAMGTPESALVEAAIERLRRAHTLFKLWEDERSAADALEREAQGLMAERDELRAFAALARREDGE